MNVLSIQSGVVYGHVGNAAAQFCLQRLGHEAWRIDTVRFSNHPGHGGLAGETTAAAEILRLVEALAARGWLADCAALLSGYLGAAEQGDALAAAFRHVRTANPRALWLLDPVIGDHGRIFVKPGIPEFLRDVAAPQADILTPNAFELSWLTGMPVDGVDTALAAARRLRGDGTRVVVATGLSEPGGGIATLCVHAEGADIATTPRVDVAVNGTGDSFAAIFLARLLATGDLGGALSQAASAVHALLVRTRAAGARELLLIDGQDDLVSPAPRFPARRIA
jgi:pyridoxine kinase